MTSTKPETWRAQSDRITAAISGSTCTTALASELQALLNPIVHDEEMKENVKPVKLKASVQVTAARTKTGASARAKTKATIVAETTTQQPPTTPKERLVIATSVVNASLKALTEALKQQQLVPPPPQTSKTSRRAQTTSSSDDSRPPLSRTASHAQRPLQPRSLSQASTAVRTASRCSSVMSGATQRGPPIHIAATAECARLAFAYLRSAEGVQAGGKNLPPLQLENGMLALVGKLLGHGLESLAVKELQVLKRRLQRSPDGTTTSSTVPDKETLATLVQVSGIDPNGPTVAAVISYQLYVLRALAALRRPQAIEALVDFLEPSSAGSPANVITEWAAKSANEAKASKHLESLAQAILSLCPSIASSEDTAAGNPKTSPTPGAVLRLQRIAFQIRYRAKMLAQSEGSLENEVLELFSRCLNSYARRSNAEPKESYLLAKEQFSCLQHSFKSGTTQQKDESSQLPALTTIYRRLSSLAQAASLQDEALLWLGVDKPSNSSSRSDAVSASHLVKVATLSLEKQLKGDSKIDLEGPLNQAMQALRGTLKVDHNELDNLLCEVTGLRRAATKAFIATGSKQSNSEVQPECFLAISACLRFLIRYLGTRPDAEADPKSHLRYGQRMLTTKKLSKGFIDAALVACRALVTSSSLKWEDLDACLAYIVSLANEIQGENDPENEESLEFHQSLQFPLVKVSNTYWAYSVHLKKTGSAEPSITKVMRRSIDVVRSRSLHEKQSASLALKLEKLADAYRLKGSSEEACKALSEAADTILELGALDDAAQLADKQPLNSVWSSSADVEALGRILLLRSRFAVRLTESKHKVDIFIDGENLEPKSRGLLLEWQLFGLSQTSLLQRHMNDALRKAVTDLLDKLLAVYSVKGFPLRRRRVAIEILKIASDEPSILDLDKPGELAGLNEPLPAKLAHDQGLSGYGAHIQASFKASLSLQQSSPSADTLNDSLVTWHTILDESTDLSGLASRVDDFSRWFGLLGVISQFLAVKGFDYLRIPALRVVSRALEMHGSSEASTIVSKLSELGVQYLRLGYSGKAGINFAKAQSIIDNSDVTTEAKLQWHLGYAEYLLTIGNLEKSELTLLTAENMGIKDESINNLARPSATLSEKIRFMSLVSDAAYVHSLLAMQTGHPKEALKHAKHCVTLNRRIWARLENDNSGNQLSKPTVSESDVDQLTSDVRNLSVSTHKNPISVSMTHASLSGPAFWCFVPSLYRGLTQLAAVFAHQGDFQQSVFNLEQAYKIVEAVSASPLIVYNLSARADSWMKGGDWEKALDLLGQASPLVEQIGRHKNLMLYHGSSAIAHRIRGEWDEEMETYGIAEAMLDQLSSTTFLQQLESVAAPTDSLVEKMAKVSLKTPARKTRTASAAEKPVRSTRGRKAAAKAPASTTVSKQQPHTLSAEDECQPLSALKGDLLRRKAIASLLQSKADEASQLLSMAEKCHRGQDGLISQQAMVFRQLMAQYTKAIASDFTYNVLPESTISFPAIASQKPHELLLGPNNVLSPAPKSTSRKTGSKADFVAILRQARDCLSEVQELALQIGSISTINQICSFTSQITILLSATGLSNPRGVFHPLQAAHLFEVPKVHAMNVEHASICIDKHIPSREELLTWPTLETQSKPKHITAAQFQQEYIDIIPSNWTAVSMSLNEDRDELYIIRYQAQSSPFILRLPLARHQSRDLDEDVFSFDNGRAELLKIIELSDFSTRDAQNMSAKGAKTQWWAEREELDSRLRDLLINIENIWLGGFRGIFSQHPRQASLLSKFQKAFEDILDRHLPSRRSGRGSSRGNSKTKQPKVQLDPRILDLFVGLGDASDPSIDLDEPLMDLVYFVIDVLQFSGERNAYDEIDFDGIVVDTLDALRAYHSAAHKEVDSRQHMILILDKSLHCFPWESMPSLQGQSISRLPSLAALRERLLAAKRPSVSEEDFEAGHYVSATGSTILNPSGDLKHTQKTLQPCLQDIKGSWTHLAARQPTESEFEATLRDKDLLLYFGHGSGAQYIRSRNIKKLYNPPSNDGISSDSQTGQKPNVSTTWLMGCSSAAITDHGTFEPSGTITSYITAGAPAVVGMLWDVTDKDCDRFAVRCGELWGLWGSDVVARVMEKEKGKGKGRNGGAKVKKAVKLLDGKEGDASRERKVGLDEAVARSREACLLRYLNGAAAVVYGIPVFLDW